jgi:hypothetical protein
MDDYNVNIEKIKVLAYKMKVEQERKKDETPGLFDFEAKREKKKEEAANILAQWEIKKRTKMQRRVIAQEKFRADNPNFFASKEDEERDARKLKRLRKKWFGDEIAEEGEEGGLDEGFGSGNIKGSGAKVGMSQTHLLNQAIQKYMSAVEAKGSGKSEGKGTHATAASQGGSVGPSQQHRANHVTAGGGFGGNAKSEGKRSQAATGQEGSPAGPSQSHKETQEGARMKSKHQGQDRAGSRATAIGAGGGARTEGNKTHVTGDGSPKTKGRTTHIADEGQGVKATSGQHIGVSRATKGVQGTSADSSQKHKVSNVATGARG